MALETKKGIIGKMVPNAVPKSQKKEEKVEDNAKWKKVFGYLEGFKKSFALLTIEKKEKSGIWGMLKNIFGSIGSGLSGIMIKILGALGLTGIFAKIAGLGIVGAAILPAAIIFWGIMSAFNIIQDFMEGFKEDGLSGGIAKALGGDKEGGIWNSVKQASKWGGIGALAGLAAFGPIGALVGGLLGIALGAIFGWLGSEKIQKWIDRIFGLPQGELLTDAQLKQLEKDKAEMTANIAATTTELTDIQTQIAAIKKAAADRGVMYDSEKEELDKLLIAERATLTKLSDERKARAALNKQLQLHHLAVTQENQAQVDEEIKKVGNTWTALEQEIVKIKQEIIDLERVGELTDEGRKARLDQIAALEGQVKIQKAEKSRLRDEEHRLEAEAQKQQLEIAKGEGFWMGTWVQTKQFLKNLWDGKYLPKWLREPAEEWLPLWMRQPISVTLQHDLPKAIGDAWKSWGTTLSNFWEGKDKDGNPLFNMPAWMTKPMGELFSDLGATLNNFWKGKKKDGTPLFNMPEWMIDPDSTWEDIGKSFPKWIGGSKEGTFAWSDLGSDLANWFEDLPTWADIRKSIPKWLGGTKEGTFAWSDLGTTLSNWFEDLPTWVEIQKSIPKWLGGTKEGTFAWSDLLIDFSEFKIELPTWDTIKGLLPSWLVGGGIKKGKPVRHPELPYVPDWLSDEDRFGDDDYGPAPIKQEMTGDELFNMLPAWIRDPFSWISDRFKELGKLKVEWPDINIQDLTEGVKNMIRSVLPDPVDDPWLYKLVPQKIYDWLGVSTEVREAQAKMANAQIEVEKLEQKRRDIQAKEATEMGAIKDFFGGYSIEQKDKELAENQADLLEANKNAETASAVLARTVSNSRPHLVTDIGLIIKKEGFLPTRESKEFTRIRSKQEMTMQRHIAKVYMANQTNELGALLAAAAAGSSGRGSTTINNVTVAPSSSNTVSSVSKSENVYGTVDPYTSASGAYG